MIVIDDGLLWEFRLARKCEWCGRAAPQGCDPHHLWCRGFGGGGRLDVRVNLISVCRDCHRLIGDGKIARHDLLAVVAARERCLQDDIESAIHELRRAPRGSDHRKILEKIRKALLQ